MAFNFSFGRKKSRSSSSSGRQKPKKETNPLMLLSSGAAIAVVAIVLIVVFIIQPTISSILSTQDEIEERQALLEKLEDKNRSLATARATYNSNAAKFEKLTYAIPNEPLFTEDFRLIERIAADITGTALEVSPNANFAILRISLSSVPPYQAIADQPKTGREYKRQELSFSMSAKGDYAGVQAFLEKLKKNLRNMTINQVTFSAPESKTSTLLDVNILVTSIFYSM